MGAFHAGAAGGGEPARVQGHTAVRSEPTVTPTTECFPDSPRLE